MFLLREDEQWLGDFASRLTAGQTVSADDIEKLKAIMKNTSKQKEGDRIRTRTAVAEKRKLNPRYGREKQRFFIDTETGELITTQDTINLYRRMKRQGTEFKTRTEIINDRLASGAWVEIDEARYNEELTKRE